MLILNYRQTVKDNLVMFFVNWCSTFSILFDIKIMLFWPLVISQSQRAYRWSFWNGDKLPKISVWCGLFYDVVIGPYFFKQPIIKQETVLITLLQFAIPNPRVIFHLDGARPHWGLGVRRSLERSFLVGWSDATCKMFRCCTFEFFIRDYKCTRDLLTV